jgi:hypothetical protein
MSAEKFNSTRFRVSAIRPEPSSRNRLLTYSRSNGLDESRLHSQELQDLVRPIRIDLSGT